MSSNIEGSTILVGDKICAQVGPALPKNDYIKFICEDVGLGSRNIFEDQGEPKEFGGTVGDSLTIESSTPGVLVICDIEIEI